jgi:hypothetical protein
LSFLVLLTGWDAWADQVDLGWNQSIDTTVIGYKVYHGTASRNYTDSVDVGNAVTYLYTGLSDTEAHYFAVTDYSSTAESGFSNELVCYPVQVSVTGSGQVTPGDIILAQGASQAFTIIPAAAYTISQVAVDGVSVGAVSQYTFSSLSAVHTLTAVFVPATYTITPTAGANGSISPSAAGTVNYGASQTFTVTPNTGYSVSNVTVDGASVGAVTRYTFSNISANHTITAVFSPITFSVYASAAGRGNISPSGNVSVAIGKSQTFELIPISNNKVSQVLVDGSSVGAGSSYSFSNVSGNHTILAVFTGSYQISASTVGKGAVSPAGNIGVSTGETLSFTMTPAPNYQIANLAVDGKSVGAVSSYTFVNITTSHTIQATFTPITATSNTIAASFAKTGRKLVSAPGSQPTADAGPTQEVAGATDVTLNASNSRAANGSIASYQWTQTGGAPVVIANPAAAQNSFTAPAVGPAGAALTFEVTVSDSAGLSAVDTCIVNVVNADQPPDAIVGPDQTVSPYSIVTLDGSQSTDMQGSGLASQWRQIGGTAVVLSTPQSAKPTFVAPEVNSGGTALVFRLTVTDGLGLESTQTSIVNVTSDDVPPVAVTGADQTTGAGVVVTLDGSNSSDSGGGIASYWWRQTSGFPVTLSDPRTVKPTFTAPAPGSDSSPLTFELTVTDSGGLKARAVQTVTVR